MKPSDDLSPLEVEARAQRNAWHTERKARKGQPGKPGLEQRAKGRERECLITVIQGCQRAIQNNASNVNPAYNQTCAEFIAIIVVAFLLAEQSGKDPVLSAWQAFCEAVEVMHPRYALRKAGLFVIGCAHTGEEAVQVVLHSKPDLVLMDINMPEMNGLDAAEQILSQYPVCVVILTAYDARQNRARAKEIGVTSYLVKPIQAEALLRQLEEAFTLFHAWQKANVTDPK